MPTLYHFWSSPQAQRVRLALGCKQLAWEDRPLRYDDDETFFELGTERKVPLLHIEGGPLLSDSEAILWRIDALFPGPPLLIEGRLDAAAWQALLAWRAEAAPLLDRLYAPLLPAYRDIGEDEATLAAYKAEVAHRFGLSVEELANDRYEGYRQLERVTRMPALARHLARARFYMGPLSAADMLLTADLFPLQLLDGISLPVDLLYYFERVQEACKVSLREGLLPGLQR